MTKDELKKMWDEELTRGIEQQPVHVVSQETYDLLVAALKEYPQFNSEEVKEKLELFGVQVSPFLREI